MIPSATRQARSGLQAAVAGGKTHDEYQLAYHYGGDSYTKYLNPLFDNVEPKLSRDWNTAWGTSSMDWERAKHASRDA